MHTTLHADPAVAALAAAAPRLIDVRPAGEVVGELAAGGVSHAGPPIGSRAMCAPMRTALGVALAIEGRAPTAVAALALLDAGEIALHPNHDLGGVGPMSGAVTASMPVLVARDEATGRTAWCPLNEGSGKVLRYGADGPEVVQRLQWMRDVLGPALSHALAQHGPLDLLELQREALELGDECHHRTDAGSRLTHDALAPWLSAEVRRFILGNSQFFLNLAMVSAKLAMVCAEGVPGSSLVTVIARNGVEVGVQLSGTGAQWFTGPAAMPDPARLVEPYGTADMNPDLGDSAIVEVYGLGALALSASPLAAPSVGLTVDDAPQIMERLRRIAAAEHPTMRLREPQLMPALLGVDARAVVETGIRPPIHTGIAHREPGVGQIGGGVTHPPFEAFLEAVAALEGLPAEAARA
ncbi:MAG TPA: DUF1116 domain-containing protein [Baekduia sp.]|uniref:DUF1116 domain-containing protein n=1 Tax=Baekduia sp. TaxID=2600305 RepID=UPI002C59FE3E|nr:DUF1116 domain-containing protein [Baekduia sp.]HMJ37205.1 DUF1116 domain-containing protein [Baekduia sp.]